MNTTHSPISALEKLNNLLASGAVTKPEYEILKGKLLQSEPGQVASQDGEDAAPEGVNTLAQLEVDHLLNGSSVEAESANKAGQELQHPNPGVIYPERPLLEPVSSADSPPGQRFEPRPGNVLRFNPLRGREPKARWFEGSTLNYVLLSSLVILLLFVGYLFSNLNGYRSEQISGTLSDRSGGVSSGTETGAALPAPVAQASTYGASIESDEPVQESPVDPEAPAAQEVQPPVLTEETAAADPESKAAESEGPVEEAPVVTTEAEAVPDPANNASASKTNQVETEAPKTETAPAAVPTESGSRNQAAETAAENSSARESEAGDLIRIGNRLESFYADFQAKPFAAYAHFAPQVEQYQSLTNVTPLEIKYNIEQRHFAEFLEARSNFDPASIRIVNRENGNIEVVFEESGEAFRKSLNQRQKTTARIRAKFDQDFRMTYFRQERVLTNETTP